MRAWGTCRWPSAQQPQPYKCLCGSGCRDTALRPLAWGLGEMLPEQAGRKDTGLCVSTCVAARGRPSALCRLRHCGGQRDNLGGCWCSKSPWAKLGWHNTKQSIENHYWQKKLFWQKLIKGYCRTTQVWWATIYTCIRYISSIMHKCVHI